LLIFSSVTTQNIEKMSFFLNIAIVILFPTLAVLALVYLVNVQKLFNYMKNYDSSMYLKLGEPHLIWNNTPKTNYLFLRYLLKNNFAELVNDYSVKKIKFIRKLLFFFVLIFPLEIILVLVAQHK